jgi:hypothetical protein
MNNSDNMDAILSDTIDYTITVSDALPVYRIHQALKFRENRTTVR